MYSLYFNRTERIIKIKKMGKVIMGNPTEEVVRYNDLYYISTDRKALKKKALEIKEKWINETTKELEEIKQIKI